MKIFFPAFPSIGLKSVELKLITVVIIIITILTNAATVRKEINILKVISTPITSISNGKRVVAVSRITINTNAITRAKLITTTITIMTTISTRKFLRYL